MSSLRISFTKLRTLSPGSLDSEWSAEGMPSPCLDVLFHSANPGLIPHTSNDDLSHFTALSFTSYCSQIGLVPFFNLMHFDTVLTSASFIAAFISVDRRAQVQFE